MSKKKESKNITKLAEKAIRKKYESKNTKLHTVVGASLKGKGMKNFYAAIDVQGIHIYEFTNEKELLEIDSLNWSEWSQVTVDHIFLKSTFDFISEDKKQEFVINDGNGKKVENIIRNNTDIKVSVTPRKWYNKILGFRSKKKWKMITASLFYLLIFSAIISGFSESDDHVDTMDDEPKTEDVAATDQKDDKEAVPENKDTTGESKADAKKKEQEKQKKLEEEKQKTKEEKEEKEKKKAKAKEKADKEKKYYSDELQADLESYMNRFDSIWEEIWVPTFTGIGDGTVDIYTAYGNLKELRSKYDVLSSDIRSIEVDDIMSDKNVEILQEFKSEFTTAINLRNDAAKKAMKMIDKGDFSPSEVDKIMDTVSYSDNSVLTAVSKKVELDLNYDLLDED